MQFTKIERLILTNQYQILKYIDLDNAAEYQQKLDILKNGYEFEYDNLINSDITDSISKDICHEVLDVLQMFDWLNELYEKLPEESKKKIDISEINFGGFDANQEFEHLNYAEFLCNKETGRLSVFSRKYLKDGVQNSHFPMLANYKKMVDAFKNRNRENDDLESIKNVINSKKIKKQEYV